MKKIFFVFILLSNFLFSNPLYEKLELSDKISLEVFTNAMKGFHKVTNRKNNLLTIVDFTKPSTEPRFLVIDLDNQSILYYTYTSHGKNSGGLIATHFSNTLNSYQSSLGFYLTDKTYVGEFGYSMRLHGLEDKFNSNAFTRDIVVHGAEESSKRYIDQLGFLGRSLGCPSVPPELNKEIIDTIKDGSVLFIAGVNDQYLKESTFINQ